MSERLRTINHRLHALDDAHRLGRLSRADYRAQRRRLLATLVEGDGITARQPLSTATVPRARVPSAPPPQRGRDEAVAALFPWWTRLFAWCRALFGRG